MGILTLLRNAFGRSRKPRPAEAEGADQLPSQSKQRAPEAPAAVPEPREATTDEHELVSAAFDNVTVPKQANRTIEPDLEVHTEPTPEPEPTEPATEPEAAAAPVAEVAEEAAPEPAAEVPAEPEADPVAEAAAEAAAEPTPDPEPETEPVAETEAEPVSEPETEPVAETEAEPVSEPEPAAETAAEPTPQPEPEAEAAATPEPAAETAAEPTPQPEPEAEAAATPEPVAETAPEPTPETAPEPVEAPAETATPEPAAAADGEPAPQGPPAPDDEPVTGGAGGNTKAEGEAEATPPGDAATTALAKANLTGTRAATYLVLDRSASMRAYYKDGSAAALADQTLALATRLTPDGETPSVHVVFFSTEVDGTTDLTPASPENAIDDAHAGLGRMGRTSYHAAVEAVLAHYDANATPGAPALVVFQTDGAPDAKTPATQSLTDAAKSHPSVFFSFVAFGEHENKAFDYLRKLKTDNAAFFHAGPTPLELTDAELYDGLLIDWRP
ncbi:VWA domain-containing protein [Streptomyces sp. NPDC013157]|uniref:VWA domain-containing protein n=1 Tax=Streptomyces sp. NPDC013157 TaxID=3364861 RepID=UPI0036D12E79